MRRHPVSRRDRSFALSLPMSETGRTELGLVSLSVYRRNRGDRDCDCQPQASTFATSGFTRHVTTHPPHVIHSFSQVHDLTVF
jgi:hypothetical protein